MFFTLHNNKIKELFFFQMELLTFQFLFESQKN